MLLTDAQLEGTALVANNAMNRARGLESYRRELRFDVAGFLAGQLRAHGAARWLDLCCGEGRALIEAARRFAGEDVAIRGVDLVPYFAPVPAGLGRLTFEVASVHGWEPPGDYDLITCVHGLHYVGDKLGLLARMAGRLAPDGALLAHLDLADVRLEGGSAARQVPAALRAAGFEYARGRLVRLVGGRRARLPFEYLGAESEPGSNWTGQPSVVARYRRISGALA